MESLAELIVVATLVALAAAYLTRRYFRSRQKGGSPCGKGTCGCPTSKPRSK